MLEAIQSRRSIRQYKADQKIDAAQLNVILESARIAPSGSNTQPWHFVVVQSDENRQRVADVSHNQQWMMTAPLHIACVADIGPRVESTSGMILNETSPNFELKQAIRDVSIAAEHMILQAESLGLGSCWVAWFTQDQIRPVLNIPENQYVVAVLTFGYPDESPNPRPRKAMNEMVHYEVW